MLLEDILEAIDNIQKYISRGKESFQNEELIQTWMIHHLQIIGEAARKNSNSFKTSNSNIPWNKIIAMRHILVHDYFGIDMNEVWSSIEKDIPELKIQIQKILQK